MLELLGVLAVLLVVAIPATVIYLVVQNASLRRRVDRLEGLVEAPAMPPGAPIADRKADAPEIGLESPAPEPERAVADAIPERPTGVPQMARARRPSGPVGLAPGFGAGLAVWLRENWFYAVSAVSLALAGIFLVQYGIENGLLPPPLRVLAALAFGAALIAAGEWIRRRSGDGEDTATAYLPSTFSGAGIVSLFAGILSARMLYGLIGPEIAFAGLAGVAGGAILLGWFHGPLLVTVGVVGATVAPFIVGGAGDGLGWLYGYFALVALAGLGVDAFRQWRWVSVLSVGSGLTAGWLTLLGDTGSAGLFLVYMTALALAAILVPVRRRVPDHPAPPLTGTLAGNKKDIRPHFVSLLAAGTVLAASVSVALVSVAGEAEFWLAALALTALAAALVHWSARAPGIEDLAALPALGLVAAVVLQSEWGDAYNAFAAAVLSADPERIRAPGASWIVGLGVALSAVAFLRSEAAARFRVAWGAVAAFSAPALAVIVEVTWHPAQVIGPYAWALHAMGLAALSVLFAERFSRRDGAARGRVSCAALAGLASITFALVIILSSAALTLALAATVIAACGLDRRFALPAMEWYLAAATAAIGYRLVADPGLIWAETAPLAEVIAVYGGVALAFVAGLALLGSLPRPRATVLLESAAWSAGGLLASVLLQRWLEARTSAGGFDGHWGAGLLAAIWFGLAMVQLWRVTTGGPFRRVRIGLSVVFALLGLLPLLAGLLLANPLTPLFVPTHAVHGPPVLNTLTVAYLIPALVLGLGARKADPLPRRLATGAGIALAAYWLAVAIRHAWRGTEGMPLDTGFSQPELYTYTIALLTIGAGLFYQALARGSERLRLAGLAVIGLAVAKVFLVDISGLGGLIRVFSLLALGLSLAGLAWLNRWARDRSAAPEAS